MTHPDSLKSFHESRLESDHIPHPGWSHSHIPFAIWLIRNLQPKLIIDHGASRHRPSFNLSRAIAAIGSRTKCYSVETCEDDESPITHPGIAWPDPHFERYTGIVRLLRLTLNEALAFFPDSSIDLLYIDTLHSYEAAKRLFEGWLPKLAPLAVVLLHGTKPAGTQSGIARLWDELSPCYPLHLEFTHSDGLGVLQIQNEAGPSQLEWLRPGSSEQEAIVHYFEAHGSLEDQRHRNLVSQDAASQHHQLLEEGTKEIEALRYALAAGDRELQALRRTLGERDATIAALNVAAAERDAILASTSWRITQPLRVLVSALRGDPMRKPPINTLHGIDETEAIDPRRGSESLPFAASKTCFNAHLHDLSAIASLRPLVTYPDPSPASPGRVTLVLDSLDPGSEFNGRGSAVLFAVALARSSGLRLRLVTRNSPPAPTIFGAVLSAHGVNYAENIDFDYAPPHAHAQGIAVADNELFLTASWWDTWAARKSFAPSRILYLVQEDERRCLTTRDHQIYYHEILSDTRLHFVVNTLALYDCLVTQGLLGIIQKGLPFEPAFPATLYYKANKSPIAKSRFLLYASQGIAQNHILPGLQAVKEAIEKDILPPANWEFFFAGETLAKAKLPLGVQPKNVTRLLWTDYGELVRSIDLGLVLTAPFHPNRTALDLAACGAVVISNYSTPSLLGQSCGNILYSAPVLANIIESLGWAVRLVANTQLRDANYVGSRMIRDWTTAFSPVLESLPNP